MPDAGPEIVTLRPSRTAFAAPARIPVRWRHACRAQRVSLRICPRQGAVVVTLPPQGSRRAGLALVREHLDWVMQHLAALSPAVEFEPGAKLLLGGQSHLIRHEPRLRGTVRIEGRRIVVPGARERLAGQVGSFLKAEAKRRIAALAVPHAAALGVRPRAIRVKDTRSRWGSCAPDGTLAFSWRLVMAPEWVTDYVVAHEVAHLRELNHSPRFWDLVAALSPHRDAAVAWLRANGPALLRVG
ncbi:M48 family metallopeptidase [Falsiroseomonas oryziterrae]|uniref:M48 family metallopeptidase n=1 Tax=Falsiroseomonas oryziterrae TaxID=2911368 RepID=UPI001F35AAA4|nr:SprT family zinc-dependent metalloprotease [Roseomonas sp. NPKOSM-4]